MHIYTSTAWFVILMELCNHILNNPLVFSAVYVISLVKFVCTTLLYMKRELRLITLFTSWAWELRLTILKLQTMVEKLL